MHHTDVYKLFSLESRCSHTIDDGIFARIHVPHAYADEEDDDSEENGDAGDDRERRGVVDIGETVRVILGIVRSAALRSLKLVQYREHRGNR